MSQLVRQGAKKEHKTCRLLTRVSLQPEHIIGVMINEYLHHSCILPQKEYKARPTVTVTESSYVQSKHSKVSRIV